MKKHLFRTLLCMSLVLGLSSCSMLQKKTDKQDTAISFPTVLPILSRLPQNFQAYQQLYVETDKKYTNTKNASFEAVINADKNNMMIAVMAMGIKVWNINFDGIVITEERAEHVPEALQAQYLIRDIALAYWPKADLQDQLKDWTILEDNNKRLIYAQGQTVPAILITYSKGASPLNPDGQIKYENYLFHYNIIIDSSRLK